MTGQGAPETTEQAPVPVQGEKEEKMVENQTESDDEDFAADTQELEDAAESSESESEENKSQDDVVEEDYMVQIKNGEIQKMQFAKEEAESQEEIEEETPGSNLNMLQKTLPDQDDEDKDYNPCEDTLSDVEVDEADSQEESSLPVKKLDALHKRTGAPLTEIEMNTDEIKIPPADFVMQVAAEGNDENAMEE